MLIHLAEPERIPAGLDATVLRSYISSLNAGNIEVIEVEDAAVDEVESLLREQRPTESHPREMAVAHLAHRLYGVSNHHSFTPQEKMELNHRQQLLQIMERDSKILGPALLSATTNSASKVEDALSNHASEVATTLANLDLSLSHESFVVRRILKQLLGVAGGIGILLLILVGLSIFGHSQTTNPNVNIDRVGGTKIGAGNPLPVDCVSGCSAVVGATDVNLMEYLGVAPSATNPVAIQLSNGAAFYDARTRSWALSSATDSVEVKQATGTNLHIVLDSGTLTSITNSVAVTGTFFQATQPVSGTVTVTDGAGALNVIVDSGAITATLSAETTKVIGTVRNVGNVGGVWDTTQNAAQTANNVSIGCAFTSTPNTITTGNQGAVNCNSKGELLTQLTDGTTNVAVIAATTALKTDLSSVAGTATSTATSGVQLVGIEGRAGTSFETTAGVLDHNLKNVNNAAVSTAASGVQKVGIVGNAGGTVDAAIGAAPPANAIYTAGLGSGATGGFLLGTPICDTQAVVNISTATTTLIVTGVSGRHVRICGFSLLTAAANNVAFLSGTGATCGTGTAGMSGGTSAASGYNFAANGGIAHGSGLGTVLKTVATGDSVCLITSASTQLSGQLSYTIY